MTLRDISTMYNTLAITLAPETNKQLPIDMSFILIRNFQKLTPIMTDLERSKKALLLKYAARDENGEIICNDAGGVMIKKQKETEFWDENAKLFDTEIEVTFDKITDEHIKESSKDGYTPLTVAELMAINYMM